SRRPPRAAVPPCPALHGRWRRRLSRPWRRVPLSMPDNAPARRRFRAVEDARFALGPALVLAKRGGTGIEWRTGALSVGTGTEEDQFMPSFSLVKAAAGLAVAAVVMAGC